MKKFIALKTGFYEGRRRKGAVFVAPDDFNYSWAEEVKAPDAPKPDTLKLPQKGKRDDGRTLV